MYQLTVTVLLTAALSIFAGAALADEDQAPACVRETEPLMSMATPWPKMQDAAESLPPDCFDGYFAEGISDTLVRKAGADWDGLMNLLRSVPSDGKFFKLLLGSINLTVASEDIDRLLKLARNSCPRDLSEPCKELAKEAEAVLSF